MSCSTLKTFVEFGGGFFCLGGVEIGAGGYLDHWEIFGHAQISAADRSTSDDADSNCIGHEINSPI